MNGQNGLFSGISHHPVSVRDAINQVVLEYIGSSATCPSSVRLDAPQEEYAPVASSRRSIRETIRQIRESYKNELRDETKARVVLVRDGKLLPGGPSQEEIAVAVALDMSGKKPLSPWDRREYNTALYLAIKNMLWMRGKKYEPTCPQETIEDLVQECMYKILKKLHSFNPEKGSFTTWVWYVCDSTLNRRYRSGQRLRSRVVLASDILILDEDDSDKDTAAERMIYRREPHETECPGIMSSEIMDAVRELAGKYPKQQPLIFEMFGNPDSDDFVMRSQVSVSESAKAIGMDYNKARVFYSKVIRPFFRRQFAGCAGC